MDKKKGKEGEITHNTGHLETGSARLYYQSWFPKDVRHVMVVVHGLGEHSGRYGNIVEYFAPRGYAVFVADHRGHGRSSGIRGHVNSFLHYRDDLHAFMAEFNASRGSRLPSAGRARTASEKAQELAYEAMESDNINTAVELAMQAVELDRRCLDALIILAHAGSDSRRGRQCRRAEYRHQ